MADQILDPSLIKDMLQCMLWCCPDQTLNNCFGNIIGNEMEGRGTWLKERREGDVGIACCTVPAPVSQQ